METKNQSFSLNSVRSALHFAVIVWSSQTRGCILRQSVAPLLSAVVEIVLQNTGPGSLKNVGIAILTACAAAKNDPSLPDDNRESLWRFAMTSVPSDLGVACKSSHLSLACSHANSFQPALRIISSRPTACAMSCSAPRPGGILARYYCSSLNDPTSRNRNPLHCSHVRLCVGPWCDYFKPTPPPVSQALKRVCYLCSMAIAHYMLCTPFTLNLVADLKSVLEETRTGEYFLVLKKRLDKFGALLLDQVGDC
jgi:hypothetical protein